MFRMALLPEFTQAPRTYQPDFRNFQDAIETACRSPGLQSHIELSLRRGD